jgi:hypothetical protein
MQTIIDLPRHGSRRRTGVPVIDPEQWGKMLPRSREHARRGGFIPGMAGGQTDAPAAPAVVPMLPFTASAHEHTEPAFTVSSILGASSVNFNPQDVPAYGYFRHLLLEVTATAGVIGTAVANADFPFNIIQSVNLQDVNGANLVGPISGYQLYLANLIGGYAFNQNAVNDPGYVGSAPNPKFFLRVPVEISSRDGLGALANQNAASEFKLTITLAPTTAILTSGAFGTAPTITIRGWLEAWTLPAATNNRNEPQAQVPPLLGTGQFWTASNYPISVGANQVPLRRVGNLIRNIVLVGRTAAGLRDDTVLPADVQFNWDGNQIGNVSLAVMKKYLSEKLGGPITYPAGVVVLPFSHFLTGRLGNDTPDGWLPTTSSSRIEFAGSSTAAGTMEVLVNEVAPVEPNQAARFQVPSATGTVQA